MTINPCLPILASALLCCQGAVVAQRQFDLLQGEHLPLIVQNVVASVAADLDGDGRCDLFFAGERRRLLLQRGPGRFVDATGLTAQAGRADRDVATLDFDGDGDLDLVIGGWFGGTSLLRNDGAGSFADVTAAQPWAGELLWVGAVATGDFDGDGFDDVVFGGEFVGRRAFRGGSSGMVACSGCEPDGLSGVVAVLLEDFDADGDLDLLRIANASQTGGSLGRLDRNEGGGSWTPVAGAFPDDTHAWRGAVVVDYDHDGDLDVLTWGDITILNAFRNDGQGQFVAAGPIGGFVGIASVDVIDRDGDGRSDLLLSGAGTFLLRGLWNGRFGSFSRVRLNSAGAPSKAAVACDADGDGDLDVAVWQAGAVELLLDEGGQFLRAGAAQLIRAYPGTATGAVFGDLDGDGDLDALLGGSTEPGIVARIGVNEGGGRFRRGLDLRPPQGRSVLAPDPEGLALADVDGDGLLDAVLAQNQAQPLLYLNLGRPEPTLGLAPSGALPDVATPTLGVACGDVDGDQDVDIVFVGNGFGGGVPGATLLLGDGLGSFQHAPLGSLPTLATLARGVDLVDTDLDGDLDLLIAAFEAGGGSRLRHWRNDGSGRFVDASPPFALPGPELTLAVGDIDGDGFPDAVLGESLLLGDGRGDFIDVTARRFAVPPGAVPRLADVDLDGDLDLFTRERSYRQHADGSFVVDPDLVGTGQLLSMAVVDVDDDGDPDLLTSEGLLRNLHRELEVPLLPRIGGSLRVVLYSEPTAPRPGQVGLLWISASRLASPVDLGVVGRLWIDPDVVVASRPVLILVGGRVEAQVALPNDASLAGAQAHLQAMLLGATYADWRLSRAETVTILR